MKSLLLWLPLAWGWLCGTDSEFLSQYAPTPEDRHRRSLQEVNNITRADTWEPIRFHFEYFLYDLTPELEVRLINRIEKFTVPWFQHVLKVHPVVGNLTLANEYSCGPIVISEELQTVGVPADIIIFVISASAPNDTFAAQASPCINEGPPFENVIAGFLEVNTFYYQNISAEEEQQLFPHEMTHVLGFVRSLFDYYHKAPYELYELEEIMGYSFARGAPVRTCVLPQVVEAAREEFGCPSLQGVEFEGTTEDVGSHWEKRILFNEYMVSDITITEVVFSRITLALLNSTGWYYVENFEYTQPIGLGYKEGCNFLNDPCIAAEEPLFDFFCTSVTENVCNFNHLHIGGCDLTDLTTPVPLFYQWFVDSELGSLDMYADFCPYTFPNDDGDCRGRGIVPTFVNPDLYGDEACTDCRCVEGTIINPTYQNDQAFHASCYRVLSCDLLAHEVTLKVGVSEVNCSFAGGQVQVDGYLGFLNCPVGDILCRPQQCLTACSGVGICSNGTCNCDIGYGGVDCGTICSPLCRSCEDGFPDVCTDCYDNAFLTNDTCECQPGFTQNETCIPEFTCNEPLNYLNGQCVETCPENTTIEINGVCTECNQNCLTCQNSTDSCMSCPSNEILYNNQCVQACPFGTFLTQNTCEPCSDSCQACVSSPNFCIMCRPPLVLYEGQCVSVCPRYITVQFGNICFPCSSSCETCKEQTDACTTCPIGFNLLNSTCVAEVQT